MILFACPVLHPHFPPFPIRGTNPGSCKCFQEEFSSSIEKE